MAKIPAPFSQNTYKQAEIKIPEPEALNIEPISGGSAVKTGDLISPKYRASRSGWRVSSDGTAEFQDGIFNGTFSIGGTVITVDDVADIGDSITIINNAGGGTLYLANGTYLLTADIDIPSGVTLRGVSRDAVIIDCNNSYAVKIAGTNAYSTGTVTINNGDTTLVGSGTTWTSAMVGRYVLLDGLWYEITAFNSTTSLTIDTYRGNNLAGSAYVLADTNFVAQIKDVTVTNATGSGIVSQYAMETTIENVYVYDCGTGIDLDYSIYPQIITVTVEDCGVGLDMNQVDGFYVNFGAFNNSTTGAGVLMNTANNATFFNSSVNDNTGDGINITSCQQVAFISLDVSGNGGQGIEFVSGNTDNMVSESVINNNASDGIKMTATTDRTSVIGVSITNSGGYGINIAASTCDENYITAPAFSTNTSGNINDSGTNTTILGRGGALFVGPADTYLLTSDTTEASTASGTYVKLMEINLGNYAGKLRIKFDMKNSGLGTDVYARVYRNGVAVGTEQSTGSGTYSTKSEDILDWNSNDLVQIYGKGAGSDSCFVDEFKIYADKTLTPVVL